MLCSPSKHNVLSESLYNFVASKAKVKSSLKPPLVSKLRGLGLIKTKTIGYPLLPMTGMNFKSCVYKACTDPHCCVRQCTLNKRKDVDLRGKSLEFRELLWKGGKGERKSFRFDFSRSLLGTRPPARPGSGKPGQRRPTRLCLLPRRARGPGPVVSPPPEVGWTLGPAPARSRRPSEVAEARDSHVRVPPEGVSDVLHHPLHQHRHFLAGLGHVGGGRDCSSAPPRKPGRQQEFRGERARGCAG